MVNMCGETVTNRSGFCVIFGFELNRNFIVEDEFASHTIHLFTLSPMTNQNVNTLLSITSVSIIEGRGEVSLSLLQAFNIVCIPKHPGGQNLKDVLANAKGLKTNSVVYPLRKQC